MPEDASDRAKLRVPYPPSPRKRRREIPAVIRYSLIVGTGMVLAVGCSYLLRKLGY